MFTASFFIPFTTSIFKVLDNNTNYFILKLSVLLTKIHLEMFVVNNIIWLLMLNFCSV